MSEQRVIDWSPVATSRKTITERTDAIAPLLQGVPAGTTQDTDLAAQAARAFNSGATTTPVTLEALEVLAQRVRDAEQQATGWPDALPPPEASPLADAPDDPVAPDDYDAATGPADDGFPEHTCPYRAEIRDDYSLCTCSPNRALLCAREI